MSFTNLIDVGNNNPRIRLSVDIKLNNEKRALETAKVLRKLYEELSCDSNLRYCRDWLIEFADLIENK